MKTQRKVPARNRKRRKAQHPDPFAAAATLRREKLARNPIRVPPTVRPPSDSDLLAAMAATVQAIPLASAPPGSFTVRDYAAVARCSNQRAALILMDGIEQGRLRRVLVRNGDGRPAYYYNVVGRTIRGN